MRFEMGGTCGTREGREMHTWSSSEILKEGDHLQDLGVYGNIVGKWMLKKYMEVFELDSSGSA
jgi:hypothetical protein